MDAHLSSATSGRTVTILVVDDDPSVLLICSRALRVAGFRVLQESGSTEALKLCAEGRESIDLLLTDFILPPPEFQMATERNAFPRVHGQELLRRIARLRPGIRIILMSSLSQAEIRARGEEIAAVPYLAKPFEVERLLRTVREVLAGPAPTFGAPSAPESASTGREVRWVD